MPKKTKKCTGCQKIKPIAKFTRNKQGHEGRRSRCTECCTKATREWRRTISKDESLLKKRNWSRKNYQSYLLSQAKRLAKNAELPFDLTRDDIVLPGKCPLLGIDIIVLSEKHKQPGSASIDRIVPSLGYVKGNVKIISELANRIKQDATPEQIKTLARNIDDYFTC